MVLFSYRKLPILFLVFLALIVNQEKDRTRNSALDHPRLFFVQSDIMSLTAKANSSHAEIWAPILAYAHKMVGTLPPEKAPWDGSEDEYRNFGNRIIPLAFACAISQEVDLCDLAKQHLLRYAAWEQWGEANERNLGLAHMILGNALAYDWLHNRLNASEQSKVRQALGKWNQTLYEASHAESNNPAWGNWWRNSYMENYHWICNSALGLAGLALINEDPRADLWVDQAVAQIGRVKFLLDGIGDGSWHEGINYQSYELTVLLPFLVNLERLRDQNLFPDSYLRNYVLWRVYNLLPGQYDPALASGDFERNWGNGYESQNILRLIAGRYQDGLAEWTAQQLISRNARVSGEWQTPWYVFEFLYYNPTVAPNPPDSLPGSHLFSDQESLIWRTGWDRDALVFGFKSGVYGGRFAFNSFVERRFPWDASCEKTGCQLNIDHDHLDSNSFYLYQGGYWLAPESIGVGKRASSYHNTLLIDGQGQYGPASSALYDHPAQFAGSDAHLEISSSVPDFDYLMANGTGRYQNVAGLKQARRHVLFVRPSYLVMLDNLEADAPHRYEWVSHFGADVSLEGSWVRGGGGDDKLLGVAVVAPQQFTTTLGNDGQSFVRIAPLIDSSQQRLVHLLYPTDTEHWSTKPTVQLLDNRPNWSAMHVVMQDGSGRNDEIVFNNGANSGSGIGFNGNLAVISKNGEQIAKLYMVEGDWLADQEGKRTLIRRVHAGQSLEATYKGEDLYLYGSVGGSLEIFAPDAQRVKFNGKSQSFRRQGDYLQVSLN
ncbi:MAG: heparinase II/III family protein [Caldilineaceae bacterium]